MLLLFIFFPLSFATIEHKRKDHVRLIEAINHGLDDYMNYISPRDTFGRNIVEGTFLIAAGFNNSAVRKGALVEFFRTQGDDLNITRASHISGYHLASFPSILKNYIYQNELTTVLKKAFALIFDQEFRGEEARVQENRLACLIVNCTEEMESVKTLRSELRNIAQGFIYGIHDYLLAQTRYFSADDDQAKALFNEAVDLLSKGPKQFRQQALEIGGLFENFTESEYKNRVAEQLAKDWMSHFGGIGRVVGEDRVPAVLQKLAILAFDQKFRDKDMEDRAKLLRPAVFDQEGNEDPKT